MAITSDEARQELRKVLAQPKRRENAQLVRAALNSLAERVLKFRNARESVKKS